MNCIDWELPRIPQNTLLCEPLHYFSGKPTEGFLSMCSYNSNELVSVYNMQNQQLKVSSSESNTGYFCQSFLLGICHWEYQYINLIITSLPVQLQILKYTSIILDMCKNLFPSWERRRFLSWGWWGKSRDRRKTEDSQYISS